jgi:hypothetical protein
MDIKYSNLMSKLIPRGVGVTLLILCNNGQILGIIIQQITMSSSIFISLWYYYMFYEIYVLHICLIVTNEGPKHKNKIKNLPSDSSKNSRALPLSHLIAGRISNTCIKQLTLKVRHLLFLILNPCHNHL